MSWSYVGRKPEIQLFVEVKDKVGSHCRPATEEEIAASEKAHELLYCDKATCYDEETWPWYTRKCGICHCVIRVLGFI